MSAVIRPTRAIAYRIWSRAIADAARSRRDQVPRHLRHHLAKFIRFVTRAAQDRRHHLVRQKIVEGCPGAVAFGSPKFMGTGEPRSVKFDIGIGTILDHLTPPGRLGEIRPTLRRPKRSKSGSTRNLR